MKMVMDLPREQAGVDIIERDLRGSVGDWMQDSSIQFKNVTMRYSSEIQPVLHNISLTLEAGKVYGVVGRTGAGKSSLLAACYRLQEIDADGSILIGGQDIRDVNLQALRHATSILPQEALPIDCSIRLNLDPDGISSDDELWNALDKARIKSFVESMPGKLEHEVSSQGSMISRGNRQLLALARAIRGLFCPLPVQS